MAPEEKCALLKSLVAALTEGGGEEAPPQQQQQQQQQQPPPMVEIGIGSSGNEEGGEAEGGVVWEIEKMKREEWDKEELGMQYRYRWWRGWLWQ